MIAFVNKKKKTKKTKKRKQNRLIKNKMYIPLPPAISFPFSPSSSCRNLYRGNDEITDGKPETNKKHNL